MLLRLLAVTLVASCVRTGIDPEPVIPRESPLALVTQDSAVFVFPLPADGVWPYSGAYVGDTAALAFTWLALWDGSYRRPVEYRRHSLSARHARPPESGPRLQDWLGAARLEAGITANCGHIPCATVDAEPALHIAVRNGAVVLQLASSPRLSALQALRPDSAILEFFVRGPPHGTFTHSYRHVVPVVYR